MTKSNEAIKKAVSEILTNRKITRRVHSVQISDLYQEINLRDVDVQYFSEEITAKVIEPLIQKLQDKFMEISFKQIYGNEKTDEHIIDEDLPLTDYINYIPKKSYKKATLSLLLSKQKENSKFQRYHK